MDGTVAHPDDSDLDRAIDLQVEDSALGIFADDVAPKILGTRPVFDPRESTADPQAFPQPSEPEPALSSEEIALDTINRQLENERARCASILKSIFAFRQEYASRRKTISALEMAAERLAEGV